MKICELSDRETAFITGRDAFCLAVVSEDGWPDLQHWGGPPGFVSLLNKSTLAFPGISGDPPSRTVKNGAAGDCAVMVFTDHAKASSLKLAGRLLVVLAEGAPYAAAGLLRPDGRPASWSGMLQVEAFDWMAPPARATRRYTALELAPVTRRVSALEAQVLVLQARVAALTGQRM